MNQEKVVEMKERVDSYLSGEISFNVFFDAIKEDLGNYFDPLEDSIADLDLKAQKEILLLSRLTGGEFGEFNNEIPRDKTWIYGDNNDKYGWIDKDAFFLKVQTAFTAL